MALSRLYRVESVTWWAGIDQLFGLTITYEYRQSTRRANLNPPTRGDDARMMSDRLRSFVERMNVRPDDRVLEIGCGHGIAAKYVCQRLTGGHFIAVDRSKKMIAAAARRNAAFIQSGKAEFLVAHLESLDLGDRRFDKIFAVRVGLFYSEPKRARSLVKRWLAPRGKVFTDFDPP